MNDRVVTTLPLTEDEILAGASAKGGFTRAQLAAWGVDWPPVRGWKRRLLRRAQEQAQQAAAAPSGELGAPGHIQHLREALMDALDRAEAAEALVQGLRDLVAKWEADEHDPWYWSDVTVPLRDLLNRWDGAVDGS